MKFNNWTSVTYFNTPWYRSCYDGRTWEQGVVEVVLSHILHPLLLVFGLSCAMLISCWSGAKTRHLSVFLRLCYCLLKPMLCVPYLSSMRLNECILNEYVSQRTAEYIWAELYAFTCELCSWGKKKALIGCHWIGAHAAGIDLCDSLNNNQIYSSCYQSFHLTDPQCTATWHH